MLCMLAPIELSGSIILFIGRLDSELSPIKVARMPFPERRPANSLAAVPELPQLRGDEGVPRVPPLMTVLPFLFSESTPH